MLATKTKPRRNIISHAQGMKGYRFEDKDPDLYITLFIMDQSGMTDPQIAEKSGVSYTTLRNWRYGKTKKPQNHTLSIVRRVCGYRRVYVGPNGEQLSLPEALAAHIKKLEARGW